MNRQNILLGLLLVSLVATGFCIRAFNFTVICLADLAVMTVLSALDFTLWFLWKRAGGK